MIELNVGGTYFTTRLSTLTKDKDSMLAAMFSGRHRVEQDSQGRYFIDRDGKLFHHILTYLRHDKLPPPDMAVAVLEEAEYYQLTGLVGWCKTQDCVKSRQVIALLEREERLSGGELLTHEILAKLAETIIVDEQASLFENGVDGLLVGTVGVIVVCLRPRLGVESSHLVLSDKSLSYRSVAKETGADIPFTKSTCFFHTGKGADHCCSFPRASKLVQNSIGMAVYSEEPISPIVYVQRALNRFSHVNPCAQLDLQRFSDENSERYVAIRSRCTTCSEAAFYFEFKFLFDITCRQSASATLSRDIASIRKLLNQLTFRFGCLQTTW